MTARTLLRCLGILALTGSLSACLLDGVDGRAAASDPANSPISTKVYPVAIDVQGQGKVSATNGVSCTGKCRIDVRDGDTIGLSADPDNGYRFQGWRGSCRGTGQCRVTVREPENIVVDFAPVDAVPPVDAGTIVDTGELFADIPSPGSVPVTLHPGTTVRSGETVTVAFGVPFPKGLLADVSELRVMDSSGADWPSQAVETARWRTLGGASTEESVRSALVYAQLDFPDTAPRTITVEFGRPATARLGPQPAPETFWVGISNGPDPDEYPAAADVREPAVYGTLPADWLCAALLRSRSQPVFLDAGWAWFDDALVNYATTAVNDVASSVTPENLIAYTTEAEPWLFDRAMSLFGVYARTGELKWLRHAHRAAQFYATRVNANGAFDLKSTDDLKYSYGQTMFVDLMLTGDLRHLDPIERIARFGYSYEETYSTSLNFWTERHQTYALLAALSAWEATGQADHAERAIEVAKASFAAARQPAGGWTPQGCILHTIRQHEGDSDDRPICSPWMSALLGDAVWRYYLVSLDAEALEFLAGLGEFVAVHGIRDISDAHSELAGLWAPWYLASDSVEFSDTGPWGDIEHTCDVAGLTARGAWAARAIGRDSTAIELATERLLPGCRHNLESWHRTTDVTRPEWRLQPPRKFSWWFGTTLDLPWLAGSLD